MTLKTIPGGQKVDSRIYDDVMSILRNYKVKVTAGYAPTGHAANGEHPLGLALDIVPDPARGGTWADVDRLAARAEPTQNHPAFPWRWVGYNGDAGHGRGNHLHLSWAHPGGKVETFDKKKGGGGGILGLPGKAVGAATGAAGDVIGAGGKVIGVGGDAVDAATGLPAAAGKAVVGTITDQLGEFGARVLVYAVLIFGGAALAFYGILRLTGQTDAPTNAVKQGLTGANLGQPPSISDAMGGAPPIGGQAPAGGGAKPGGAAAKKAPAKAGKAGGAAKAGGTGSKAVQVAKVIPK